jgi:hypothetical protein
VSIGPNDFLKGSTALAMGQEIDLVGTSGPLDFDAKGDVTTAPIEVWEIVTTNPAVPAFRTVKVTIP